MIKINLLPRSINERKAVKSLAALFGVLVIAVIAGGVLYTQVCLAPKVQAMDMQATQAEELEKQVTAVESDCTTWKGKIPPIKTKLDFIKNVLLYNTQYPKLYQEIAKWTYEKVSYTGLKCDGAQVAISARAKNLDEVGRFLLNMYRATDLFTEVTISGVPGYRAGAGNSANQMDPMAMGANSAGVGPQASLAGIGAIDVGVQNTAHANYIDFTVNCKLKTPIVAPSFAGASGVAGTATATAMPQSGMPGMPGMPMPGMPPGMSSARMPGMPGQGMPGPSMPMPGPGMPPGAR